MRRKQARTCVLAMLAGVGGLLMNASGYAADDEGSYAIRGAGSQTCDAFVEAVEQDQNVSIYLRWMEGYITAANLHTGDTFEASPIVSTADTANVLLNVCQDNSELRVETALAQLLNSLQPIRVTTDSEVVEMEAGGQRLQLRRETLMSVQRALREAGFYRSSIDGLYGPGTRRAIEGYQEDQGLEVSGLPDARTLITLMLD
ncbi:MAG: peptidoglycan-binding domain-containing protein [Pseudomonadota bacterium]